MTDTRGPRYMRTVGLTLLAALLVVASCEVEQPPTAPATPTSIEAGPPAVQEELPAIADPPAVQEEPPASQAEPAADQAGGRAAVLAELRALRAERAADRAGDLAPAQEAPQEIRPEDAAALQAGPAFTPMTVRPELRNRSEVMAALMREYPSSLRDAGIGGQVVVWYYLSDTGQVLDARISQSSGNALLDDAALRVANVYQFTPAMNRQDPVPVWIQLPITFQVN